MLVNIIIALFIGALSGWLASLIMNSGGSLLRNVILGIVGGFVGDLIFELFNISIGGYVGTIIISVVGAVLILFIVNKVLKIK